jgi:hypothetical protein
MYRVGSTGQFRGVHQLEVVGVTAQTRSLAWGSTSASMMRRISAARLVKNRR